MHLGPRGRQPCQWPAGAPTRAPGTSQLQPLRQNLHLLGTLAPSSRLPQREEAQVRHLRQVLSPTVPADGVQDDPQRRPPVEMPRVWQEFRQAFASQDSPLFAHGREALPVHLLRQVLQEEGWSPGAC